MLLQIKTKGRFVKRFLSIAVASMVLLQVEAQDPKDDLLTATMLHPGDAFTAHTFSKREWAYNQAITPFPSWMWWGISDRVTAELDLEAWVGGVPSFNFRVGLMEQNQAIPAVAFETMFQHILDELDVLEGYDKMNLLRKGSSWYNRLNMSWRLDERLELHLSGGATYSQELTIENTDTANYRGKGYQNLVSPDFSIGLNWRWKRWIAWHATTSYGSTFLYVDNVPKKNQYTVGARIAPFLNHNAGFLNRFRFEITWLSYSFKDADESASGPIGFLYWQWKAKPK